MSLEGSALTSFVMLGLFGAGPLRWQDEIKTIFIGYIPAVISLTQTEHDAKISRTREVLTFGFEGWAFNIVGPPVGFATDLTPYDRQNLPYQKRSILEALRMEEANSKSRIAVMQAEIAELMKQ